MSSKFTNIDLTQLETCCRMFRAEVILAIAIQKNGSRMEADTTAKAAKMGCSICELGVYSGRAYAEVKKIWRRDGFRAIYCIPKYNVLR